MTSLSRASLTWMVIWTVAVGVHRLAGRVDNLDLTAEPVIEHACRRRQGAAGTANRWQHRVHHRHDGDYAGYGDQNGRDRLLDCDTPSLIRHCGGRTSPVDPLSCYLVAQARPRSIPAGSSSWSSASSWWGITRHSFVVGGVARSPTGS